MAGHAPAIAVLRRLFGEDLAHIGEGLELERIAGRIEEEHRRLLADLALEADIGRDDEADAGFLQPQPARAGAQGAREVPYLATGRSWDAAMDDGVPIMMETVRQQVALADPETVQLAWLGLRLNAEAKDELDRRVTALLDEYKDRPPDVDGEPYSLVVITHPDLNPPPR